MTAADEPFLLHIPKSMATDVVQALNRAGYVLFARPDQSLVVTGADDAYAEELMRQAGSLQRTIQSACDHAEARVYIARLEAVYVKASKAFGANVWVSKDIAGLIAEARAAHPGP